MPIRVLHVTSAFKPSVGGIEDVVFNLSQNLSSRGIVASVAHVAPGLSNKTEILQGTIVYRRKLIGNRFIGYCPDLSSISRNYDLLHVHDPQLLALSANIAISKGTKPTVLSTHGLFFHTNKLKLLKRLYARFGLPNSLAIYDRVLATSASDLARLRGICDNVLLAENGVSTEVFSKVKASHRRSIFKWIYWGRLSANKHLELAIDLAGQMRAKGYPIDLAIVGGDCDRARYELQALVRDKEIKDHVSMRPHLHVDDLTTELSARGVFITPSDHEGFGLSVVEAMAAGLIIICRDIAPLNKFVTNDETGLLLDFDGSMADLERVCALLGRDDDQIERMSKAARSRAKIHGWDAAIHRFIDIYNEVLGLSATNLRAAEQYV